jgi:peroxiredoxin
MVSKQTPICDFGAPAPDFSLKGINGKLWTRNDCCGPNGLLVMFICNHCPYVQAINPKLVRDASELKELGIGSVAIMPNDTQVYPDDSYENMQRVAREMNYPFPYLIDHEQLVARTYGAICTPDFFGYNSTMELQYRGRLDASGRLPDVGDVRRELFEAMTQVANTGVGPKDQVPSIGCSIKWREF